MFKAPSGNHARSTLIDPWSPRAGGRRGAARRAPAFLLDTWSFHAKLLCLHIISPANGVEHCREHGLVESGAFWNGMQSVKSNPLTILIAKYTHKKEQAPQPLLPRRVEGSRGGHKVNAILLVTDWMFEKCDLCPRQ